MHVVDPKSSAGWIEKALEFIAANCRGSGLPSGLEARLRQLHSRGKIVVREMGIGRVGGYNRLTGKITLNSNKFCFLKRDFKRQLEALECDGARPERLLQIQGQHTRAVLELSGVLVHEAQHSLRFVWSRAADETLAFRAEQQWYYHLHTLDSSHREAIEALARDAEYDSSSSPAYAGLQIDAPCLIVGGQI